MTIQELAKKIALHFHPEALTPIEVERIDSDKVRLPETERLRVFAWGNRFQKDVKFVAEALSPLEWWQPIETAPKDNTQVDLWVITDHATGHRVVNCRRTYDGGEWPDVWVDSTGHYVNFSRFIDEDGDECLQLGNTPHKKHRGWIKATHWRHPPQPPGA